MESDRKVENGRQKVAEGISSLSVAGFKSIEEKGTIEIRPLTVLAGANSSGKSSAIQPLLLLKQTLDSSYDPGALLLNGPNVRFTQSEQMFSKRLGAKPAQLMNIEVGASTGESISLSFRRLPKKGVDIAEMTFRRGSRKTTLRAGMSHDDLAGALPEVLRELTRGTPHGSGTSVRLSVQRIRSFLALAVELDGRTSVALPFRLFWPVDAFQNLVRKVIHVPGLRGNPARTYPTTSLGPMFQGTFEPYVATIINHWQENKDDRLDRLGGMLAELGLSWKVEAKQVDDTQVELRVGRMPHSVVGGAKDMVSIADVGFGVSQTLPVLVALLAAERGRLVYVEQPEIHLHPRAQVAMGTLLAEAANRGVRVVVETHSALLLLRVQTLVAKGDLDPDLVRLHWFRRRDDGVTEITSGNLDRQGRAGDWPEDFGSIELSEDKEYLDASEEASRA